MLARLLAPMSTAGAKAHQTSSGKPYLIKSSFSCLSLPMYISQSSVPSLWPSGEKNRTILQTAACPQLETASADS